MSNSSEFREGDRVRIIIDDVRIVNTYPHTHLPDASGRATTDHVIVYRTDTQIGQSSSVVLEDPAVTIEHLAPAEWPPCPGDLWRDRNGDLHFAASYSPDYDDPEDSQGIDADGVRVVLLSKGLDESCSPGKSFHRPDYVNQRSGPLTLVHREDEQDGGQES